MKNKDKENKKQEEKDEELPKEVPEENADEVKEETKEEESPEDPRDKEIEELKAEVDKLKNAYIRVHADTENLKKRLEAEAANTRKYRIQCFALEMLPVIDNLERALDAAEDKDDGFYKGVKMIYDQLMASLKKEGVEEIDCLGKDFDPKFFCFRQFAAGLFSHDYERGFSGNA